MSKAHVCQKLDKWPRETAKKSTNRNPHPSAALAKTTLPWSGQKYNCESSLSSRPELHVNSWTTNHWCSDNSIKHGLFKSSLLTNETDNTVLSLMITTISKAEICSACFLIPAQTINLLTNQVCLRLFTAGMFVNYQSDQPANDCIFLSNLRE